MHTFAFWPFRPRQLTVAGRGLRVLVADQDLRVRGDLEAFLVERGCHAFFAFDGTAAMRCLAMSHDATREVGRIDVVIADLDLPGRSGLDILMASRALAWDVDVVLTSDFVSDALGAELSRLGAAAVVGKPLPFGHLETALHGIAGRRNGR